MEVESGITDDYLPMDPKRLLQRLHTALTTRDLENLTRCFQVDFEGFYPFTPQRNFIGLEQLRTRFRDIFASNPSFTADIVQSAIEADYIWSEWRWYSGDDDGQRLNQVGTILFRVEGGLISMARFYMANVEPGQ